MNKSIVLVLVDAIMRSEVLEREVLNYKYYKVEVVERVGGVILPRYSPSGQGTLDDGYSDKRQDQGGLHLHTL